MTDHKGSREFVPLDSTSESRARKCVTHHWACDCRELEMAKLKARADKWEGIAHRLAHSLKTRTIQIEKMKVGMPLTEKEWNAVANIPHYLEVYEKAKGESDEL